MPLLRSNPLGPRTFQLGMLGALVAALLVIVAMVLLGEYTKTRGRLLLNFLVLASFCLSAIPPSALLWRGRLLPVAWAGLAASGTGFILVATGIWFTPMQIPIGRQRRSCPLRRPPRSRPVGCCC